MRLVGNQRLFFVELWFHIVPAQQSLELAVFINDLCNGVLMQLKQHILACGVAPNLQLPGTRRRRQLQHLEQDTADLQA